MTITALLLPGMDGTGRLFTPLGRALGPRFETRVIAYPRDRVLTYGELGAQIALPRGPFVLVAESFSGPIAIALAASRPPGLVGLVLAASFARSPRPWFPGW